MGLDEKRGIVDFTGVTRLGLEQHLFRVRLDGTGLTQLTTEPGWHQVTVSPDLTAFFDRHSSLAVAPSASMQSIDGQLLRVMATSDTAKLGQLGLLEAGVDVLGRVFVELQIASDATETDFTAKLIDVGQDGQAVLLGPVATGVIRVRYRNGPERTEVLVPGKPTPVRIELFDVGHTFLPGHRIRIEISSSAFPYVDANPNTGRTIATETTTQVARQTVFHDRLRPSRLLLSVIGGRPR